MIRAGCGLSERSDATEAALRAVDDALVEGGLERPGAAFVFATYPHSEHLRALAEAVTQISGAEQVIGASGTGVLTSAAEVEGRPAVAVLLVESDTVRFSAAGSGSLSGRDEAVAAELAGHMTQPSVAAGRLMVVLPAAGAMDPLRFLPALERQLGATPIVGGGATALLGQPACVYGDEQVLEGVAAMAMEGDLKSRISTFSSVRPVSRRMAITRCHGNLVYELDGLPALSVFQGLAGQVLGTDPVRAAQSLFVALYSGSAAAGAVEGAPLVRNLVGLDPARQILALSQPVSAGDAVAFCILEPSEARRRLAEALAGLREGPAPAFGLYFNCAGRGEALYGESGVDTRQMRETLGRIPMAGFFSGAEIAPHGGRSRMHLYTGVLALVDEIGTA
jgi:small ligand-binding sensory domain FIST